jgi:hypothetical protein
MKRQQENLKDILKEIVMLDKQAVKIISEIEKLNDLYFYV